MIIDKRLSKEKVEEILKRDITQEEYKDIVSQVLYQLLEESRSDE